jgi:hypothetical protein
LKKIKILLSFLVIFLVMASFGYRYQILILKKILHWQCSLENPSDTCLIQIRNLGHLTSEKGDLVEAQYWYQMGANHGDPLAMFHLAWVYEKKTYPNLFGAFKTYAEAGDITQSQLQELNNKKFQDLFSAESWYKKSAQQGFSPSMNNLGILYLYLPSDPYALSNKENKEIEEDQKAFYWVEGAAQVGNPVGQMNLAYALLTGDGLPQNLAEAEKWMNWTPTSANSADFEESTLKRTRLGEGYLSGPIQSRIKDAIQVGKSIKWTFNEIIPHKTNG